MIQLEKDQQSIQIAGVDDPDFADRDRSIQSSVLLSKIKDLKLSDEYCVLLSHRLELFDTYVSEHVDMVLSGHAHGGQFRLPFVGGIIAPNQGLFPKYDAGIYTKEQRAVGKEYLSFEYVFSKLQAVLQFFRCCSCKCSILRASRCNPAHSRKMVEFKISFLFPANKSGLYLKQFLFSLPCSQLIRSTHMHRFLESSACRSSGLYQPTVQLEYKMQSSGRLSATSNGKICH